MIYLIAKNINPASINETASTSAVRVFIELLLTLESIRTCG
jgi:hypothetical protein